MLFSGNNLSKLGFLRFAWMFLIYTSWCSNAICLTCELLLLPMNLCLHKQSRSAMKRYEGCVALPVIADVKFLLRARGYVHFTE